MSTLTPVTIMPFAERRRIDALRSAILPHGVAFLCGFDTPSLLAQGGQRRPAYFNISRDIPPWSGGRNVVLVEEVVVCSPRHRCRVPGSGITFAGRPLHGPHAS